MSTTTETRSTHFWDPAERVLWTAAETGGATGILAAYQALPLPDLPQAWWPLTLLLLAALLATIKVKVAQQFGNGTAATLPADTEPIPADATQGDLDDSMPLSDEV